MNGPTSKCTPVPGSVVSRPGAVCRFRPLVRGTTGSPTGVLCERLIFCCRRGSRAARGRLPGPPTRGLKTPLCMLICMHSTSVRIDVTTHNDLKRLAVELNTTVGNTVALAVRALRQGRKGDDLRTDLRVDEVEWLDADLG